MSDSVSAAPAAASLGRLAAAPKAARRKKAEREMRLLNGAAPIADIAAWEGKERMCALLQERLARLPEPPEVLTLEVSRLTVARVRPGAMAKANLRGVDGIVKIVREFDGTHWFAAPGRSQRAGTQRLPTPAQNPLALPAPPFVRPEMAPQAVEKLRFVEGNGAPLALAGDEPLLRPLARREREARGLRFHRPR